jgi:hypothetical protein
VTNGPTPESAVSTREMLEIATAAADFSRLLVLDRAWTTPVERGQQMSDRDREALVALGNEIDALVALVERHGHTLHRLFGSYHEWMNDRIRTELGGNHFTQSQRKHARRLLGVRNDDFVGRGAFFADSLAQRAPVEREELRSKIDTLRGNGPPTTDLSKEFLCSLAANAIVAGALTCAETAGAGCLVGAFALGFAAGADC